MIKFKDEILVCQWGYSMIMVDFYLVIKDTPKTIVARKLKEKDNAYTGFLRGTVMPDKDNFDDSDDKVLRIYKNQVGDNYNLISRKAGFARFFQIWDGKPVAYDHCD